MALLTESSREIDDQLMKNNQTEVRQPNISSETAAMRDARMAWWRDAKFGMFIHWGPSALLGGEWQGQPVGGVGGGYSEWIMFNAKIPVSEYAGIAGGFNPDKFDADFWARLAREAGQKYLIITAKHHDGFAMFASKASRFNIMDATSFGRDPLKELAEACHRHGIKLGFYYSQAQDWHHPGGSAYGGKTMDGGDPHAGCWDPAQQGSMDAYIDGVAVPQVRELLTHYGPVAVFWWDTPVGMNTERADKLAAVLDLQPGIITNDRLDDRLVGGHPGDTVSPEQYIPATGIPGRDWETCMTMNKSWGFRKGDNDWKSPIDLLHRLVDVVSKGGNFLLNIGPDADGTIPAASVETLRTIGAWLKRNGDSIYGTSASPFPFLSWGRCTIKGDILYFHIFDWPHDCKLRIPLRNPVESACLLAGTGEKLDVQADGTTCSISLPAEPSDSLLSVVALRISGAPCVSPPVSQDQAITSSSENPSHPAVGALDGNPATYWKAADGVTSAWLEIDFKQPETIIHWRIVEPVVSGEIEQQACELEARVGGEWQSVAQMKTAGFGHGAEMGLPPVTAQVFRLGVTGPEIPRIAEWQLFSKE